MKFKLLVIALIAICFVACKKEKQFNKPVGLKATTEAIIPGKKYLWPQKYKIKIAFLNGTKEQQEFVKQSSQAWQNQINLIFDYVNSPVGSDIRIKFTPKILSGNSFVGLDNKVIDAKEPTMFLFATLGSKGKNGAPAPIFDLATVRHEFGHMLGLTHEQGRPDGDVKWDDQLDIGGKKIDSASFSKYLKSPYDKKSIMHYAIQAKYTKSGLGIPGYVYDLKGELSQIDKDFISSIYPR
ncbi:hypothetical protein TH53_08665 [Pedobacter lusitanus]|uniref:Peptidase metallopeptidase domain-containing protein n=1 Tax=Pedobacter lusitanus TaxID=1503925 RepID=A0A0D0GSX9_9SPHI|nr:M12 family metallopeptidase [Pedobacter lusitanus]KIO77586.1 hypothetical protein TH53_08665 [Pedobacter lusitanus]